MRRREALYVNSCLKRPYVVTRLDAMLNELRPLRRLYLGRVGADVEDAKLAELLRAIRDWTRGDYSFSVRELLEHASLPAATALRAAIVANIHELDGTAGKRLGQLLPRTLAGTSMGSI